MSCICNASHCPTNAWHVCTHGTCLHMTLAWLALHTSSLQHSVSTIQYYSLMPHSLYCLTSVQHAMFGGLWKQLAAIHLPLSFSLSLSCLSSLTLPLFLSSLPSQNWRKKTHCSLSLSRAHHHPTTVTILSLSPFHPHHHVHHSIHHYHHNHLLSLNCF
jgi:hypothetical protein